MKKLISNEQWESTWNSEREFISEPTYADLLRKFLPKGETSSSFIEFGCSPGQNMAWFNQEFGYSVSGLDYAGIATTKDYLDSKVIKYCELFDCDIFKWSIKQYDVVFSTGLIEHFIPADNIIDIHKKATKQGGYCIIAIPNIRYLNRIIVSVIGGKELVKEHNLKLMSPKVLRSFFAEGFNILYCGYWKTSVIDLNDNYGFNESSRVVNALYRNLHKFGKICHVDNIRNPLLSPNIILIARKECE